MAARADQRGRGILAVRRNHRSLWRRPIPGCAVGAGHDLAQLPLDTEVALRSASVTTCQSNSLEWMRNLRILGVSPGRVTPCGRLTYRQMRPAKRKPCDEIAAAQQTLIFPGTGRGQEIEISREAVHSWDIPRRCRIATSYQDGLGIRAVIGLSQFVRSASGRG